MYDRRLRQDIEALADKLRVFVQRQQIKGFLQVFFSELCTFKDLKIGYFDSVRRRVEPGKIACCFEHFRFGFTRQAENNMYYTFKSRGFQPVPAFSKNFCLIASVNPFSSLVIGCLQSEFDPDRFCPVHLRESKEYFIR